jgi:hypothetical protein
MIIEPPELADYLIANTPQLQKLALKKQEQLHVYLTGNIARYLKHLIEDYNRSNNKIIITDAKGKPKNVES